MQGDDVEMAGDVSLQDDLAQEDDQSEEGWFIEISKIFSLNFLIYPYKMLITVQKVYFTGF